MGPGCFYPGNFPSNVPMIFFIKLQWGRDVSIPEISSPDQPSFCLQRFNGAGMFLSRKFMATIRSGAGYALLQWGRDVSIPEM